MDRRTLEEVRDGSEDPRGSPGRVGGPSGWSGTVLSTIGEIQDGSGDLQGGPGRVNGPLGRFGTVRQTLGLVWDDLLDSREGQNGSRDPQESLRRFVGPSVRLGTGWGPSGR